MKEGLFSAGYGEYWIVSTAKNISCMISFNSLIYFCILISYTRSEYSV